MIWLAVGIAVFIIIWIVGNVVAYRSLQQKGQAKSRLTAQPDEDTPPRAKEELERLSDLLAEIESGKGQEPVTAESVDFASVHSSIIQKRPVAELPISSTFASEPPGHRLPEEIEQKISKIKSDPAVLVWFLLENKQVVRQSSSMEEEIIQLFVTWKELLDQTQELLTMSDLNSLDLTGPDGHVRIKCNGDYTFITLLETA